MHAHTSAQPYMESVGGCTPPPEGEPLTFRTPVPLRTPSRLGTCKVTGSVCCGSSHRNDQGLSKFFYFRPLGVVGRLRFLHAFLFGTRAPSGRSSAMASVVLGDSWHRDQRSPRLELVTDENERVQQAGPSSGVDCLYMDACGKKHGSTHQFNSTFAT